MVLGKIYLKPIGVTDVKIALKIKGGQVVELIAEPDATQEAQDDCLNFLVEISRIGGEEEKETSIRLGKNKSGRIFALTLRFGKSNKKRQYALTKKIFNQLAWLEDWSKSHGQNGAVTYVSNGAGFILRKNTK